MAEIQKCTLVPSRFFDEKGSRCIFLEKYDAYLVYEGDSEPELYRVLTALDRCTEYNKIAASFDGAGLYLAVAQGNSLLLANSYPAADFVTVQYYIFAALKVLQINPEISTVCFLSELGSDEQMSLYRYFKGVEQL